MVGQCVEGPDYSRNIWSDLLLPSPHRRRLGLNLGFRPISFPQSVYPQTFVCVPVPERRSLKDRRVLECVQQRGRVAKKEGKKCGNVSRPAAKCEMGNLNVDEVTG